MSVASIENSIELIFYCKDVDNYKQRQNPDFNLQF